MAGKEWRTFVSDFVPAAGDKPGGNPRLLFLAPFFRTSPLFALSSFRFKQMVRMSFSPKNVKCPSENVSNLMNGPVANC